VHRPQATGSLRHLAKLRWEPKSWTVESFCRRSVAAVRSRTVWTGDPDRSRGSGLLSPDQAQARISASGAALGGAIRSLRSDWGWGTAALAVESPLLG